MKHLSNLAAPLLLQAVAVTGYNRCAFIATRTSTSSGIARNSAFPTSPCHTTISTILHADVISPFGDDEGGAAPDDMAVYTPSMDDDDDILELTWDNVDMVLDDMRPYLIQDGGNVIISEIDGPIVKLELQGACGTCPSSTATMKMGLERGLRERIPEIQEVIQALPESPPLDEEQIEIILSGVRPFLEVAGGNIHVEKFNQDGLLDTYILLKMDGRSGSLKSVRKEIQQRLLRHFMIAGLRIEWADEAGLRGM